MIKYLGESERWKTARTGVPNTAEFKPLKAALKSKDQDTKKLIAAATAALSKSVEGQPVSKKEPIVPGDLYHVTLEGAGLRKTWEETFDGSEKATKLFGLLAWRYFFKHDATWLATPPDTPGLGRQAWSYHVESKGARASAGVESKGTGPRRRGGAAGVTERPAKAAKFVLNQCVRWDHDHNCGRIVGGPTPDPLNPRSMRYLVRFKPEQGEPDNVQSIAEKHLGRADEKECAKIKLAK
jgi:hypothetical protein